MELKLQILAQTDATLTDPALKAELETYRERLRALEGELGLNVAGGEKTVGEYARGGKGMVEIARRYVEVQRECEAVREEIEKLEARTSEVD
jgi:hypothetical protein